MKGYVTGDKFPIIQNVDKLIENATTPDKITSTYKREYIVKTLTEKECATYILYYKQHKCSTQTKNLKFPWFYFLFN